jgi:hypothetical protein
LLSTDESIGGLFLLVKGYYDRDIMHRKAGAGYAIEKGEVERRAALARIRKL